MIFLTEVLRKDEFIRLPYNMSVLCIMDGSSVSMQLVCGPTMVIITSCISI
jgi:hypothetical protein